MTPRWQERLALLKCSHVTWIRPESVKREIAVLETDKQGRAEVVFHIPADCHALGLQLSGEPAFPFLLNNRNADGHFLVQQTDGRWVAHIVECKLCIDAKHWKKAREQLRMSSVRLRILADFLGLEVSGTRIWIAYGRERFPMSAIKRLKGAEASFASRMYQSWQRRRVDDVPLVGSLDVETVELDSGGCGQTALA